MAELSSAFESTAPAAASGLEIKRWNIPFIADIVSVTDSEQIRFIENHPAVDRIHSVPTSKKPWWVRLYFPITRFMDRQDKMFVPLTSQTDPEYHKRRAYVVERVKEGVAEEDVKRIAWLLHTKASDEELTRAVVNGVNRRFYGKNVPDDIIEAAGKTANEVRHIVTSLYLPALKAQDKVLEFIDKNPERLEGCPMADFSHHIGAAVQLLTPACKYLYNEDRRKDILKIFTQHDMPMTVQTPRIAVSDTTLEGMLDSPAKKGWTVFILEIRKAAAKTEDPLFTFGAGVDKRQCAFKFAFQKLMGDLQAELRRLEGLDQAPTERPAEVNESSAS